MNHNELELGRFLEQLQSEGKRDSQGQFTLAPARLLEQRIKYLLEAPALYGLKFVQAAVAAQASKIQIRAEGRRVTFHHDGHPKKQSDLDSTAIRDDLLSAFFAAERLAPRVELLSGGPEEAFGLTLKNGVVSLSEAPQGPAYTSLTIERPKESLWSRLWRRSEPELQLVEERATFCPIPLVINGKKMARGVLPRSHLGKKIGVYRGGWSSPTDDVAPDFYLRSRQLFAETRQPQAEHGARVYLADSQCCRAFTSPDGGPLRSEFCLLCGGYAGSVGFGVGLGESLVVLVHRGVSSFCLLPDKRGLVAVWAAENLRMDLSGLDAVRDTAFDILVDHVGNLGTLLWPEAMGRADSYDHNPNRINTLALEAYDPLR